MYRPTVRYDDVYQEYVTNVFNATHLDRSQIIRAALFIAGQLSKEWDCKGMRKIMHRVLTDSLFYTKGGVHIHGL